MNVEHLKVAYDYDLIGYKEELNTFREHNKKILFYTAISSGLLFSRGCAMIYSPNNIYFVYNFLFSFIPLLLCLLLLLLLAPRTIMVIPVQDATLAWFKSDGLTTTDMYEGLVLNFIEATEFNKWVNKKTSTIMITVLGMIISSLSIFIVLLII